MWFGLAYGIVFVRKAVSKIKCSETPIANVGQVQIKIISFINEAAFVHGHCPPKPSTKFGSKFHKFASAVKTSRVSFDFPMLRYYSIGL